MKWRDINLKWHVSESPYREQVTEGDERNEDRMRALWNEYCSQNGITQVTRPDLSYDDLCELSKLVPEIMYGMYCETHACTPQEWYNVVSKKVISLDNIKITDFQNILDYAYWRRQYQECTDWWESHPVHIAWQETRKALMQAHDALSFRLHPECRPGVMVEMQRAETGEVYRALIGDMNKLGGECDCCSGIADDDLVLRYCDVVRADAWEVAK